jgi:sulfopyruvate decarboxylase TPP-binding subunit
MDPTAVAAAIQAAGFTQVVWLPDSHLGTWERGFAGLQTPRLIRVCREGEAVAVAAGLMLGGATPLVAVQCTGFFEAGDAVRNVVHDLGLPLKLVVGVRSWNLYRLGKTRDNCPTFAEPVVRAWHLPVSWVEPETATAPGVADAFRALAAADRAHALLWGE